MNSTIVKRNTVSAMWRAANASVPIRPNTTEYIVTPTTHATSLAITGPAVVITRLKSLSGQRNMWLGDAAAGNRRA